MCFEPLLWVESKYSSCQKADIGLRGMEDDEYVALN
ncbi:hypothetical protein FuraDRAFT_3093 [Pseudogulbenkiania ferrooxidans 2002]|uniref:Uncharacterized protein n=1 Tax=Pseudogulbenkiania ferrooxidans 2002 TaxID=279714 RepID=B9Z6V7_9NEIS|nr:hypothetical protein FuraDRAFT_3093 [Pseudogulbenkiania ferrooxidans 2002]